MARKLTGYLVHVPLNSGGYTRRGEYYGTGQRLYRYSPDENCDDSNSHEYIHHGSARGQYMRTKPPCPCSSKYFEFRASDRKDAIQKLHAKCPKARVRAVPRKGGR